MLWLYKIAWDQSDSSRKYLYDLNTKKRVQFHQWISQQSNRSLRYLPFSTILPKIIHTEFLSYIYFTIWNHASNKLWWELTGAILKVTFKISLRICKKKLSNRAANNDINYLRRRLDWISKYVLSGHLLSTGTHNFTVIGPLV